MENQPTEENYNRDLNANPNENVDDGIMNCIIF